MHFYSVGVQYLQMRIWLRGEGVGFFQSAMRWIDSRWLGMFRFFDDNVWHTSVHLHSSEPFSIFHESGVCREVRVQDSTGQDRSGFQVMWRWVSKLSKSWCSGKLLPASAGEEAVSYHTVPIKSLRLVTVRFACTSSFREGCKNNKFLENSSPCNSVRLDPLGLPGAAHESLRKAPSGYLQVAFAWLFGAMRFRVR
jgi:hypothetical protein